MTVVDLPSGAHIEYLETGTGHPLVYFHGAGGVLRNAAFMAALGQRYRVLAPSRPGYDGSTGDCTTAREEAEFRAHRTRSRELWQEATEFIPRGVPSSFQDTPPQPVFIDYGKGSRVWDVDGNEYVDFHNGFGVMVVGHAHPAVVAAVDAQMHRGSHFAQPVAENIVVARELARRFHQPQWRAALANVIAFHRTSSSLCATVFRLRPW